MNLRLMQHWCINIIVMGITRQTKQVKKLISIFDDQNNKAIAVADLVRFLAEEMNKSTVYRILDKLMQDGIIHSFIGKNGLKWYAKCQDCSCENHNDIHPHFQCKQCGEVKCLPVSFSIPPINGFKVDSVSVLMIGECCNCL